VRPDSVGGSWSRPNWAKIQLMELAKLQRQEVLLTGTREDADKKLVACTFLKDRIEV
jgi:hypothetical protein